MTLVDFFDRFISIEDKDAAFAFLMAHPILMCPDAKPALEDHLADLDRGHAAAAEAYMQIAQELGRSMHKRGGSFPVGSGPVEQLYNQWRDGEITEAHALREAGTAVMGNALSPLYVRSVSDYGVRSAEAGDWRRAVSLFRLLLAALDARTDQVGCSAMRKRAVAAWLVIVTHATNDIPDGRLFYDAKRRGEAVVAEASAEGEVAVAASMRHGIGVLHLDPYMAGRTSSQFSPQIKTWRARLHQTYGAEVATWSPPEEAELPEASEGLQRAADYLRAALPDRTGDAKGLTLKAMADALIWCEIAGGPARRDEALAAAKEALTLLESSGNKSILIELHNIIAFLADAPPSGGLDAAEALSTVPLGALLERLGPTETGGQLRMAANLLRRNGANEAALTLAERAAIVAREHGTEAERMTATNLLAVVLADMAESAVPGLRARLSEAGALAAVRAVEEAGQAENWPPYHTGQILVGLAAATSAHDLEDEAPAILAHAIECAPELGNRYGEVLDSLYAMLALGAAVNSVNAEEPAEAILRYMDALARFVRIDAPGHASDMLNRALDLVDPAKRETIHNLAVGLAGSGVGLEAIGGPGIRETVQRAWRKIMAAVVRPDERQLNPELMMVILQGAKGSAFASAWEDWHPVELDEQAVSLLARIATARAALAGQEDATPKGAPLLDENMLLTSYLGAGQDLGGGRPEEVLQNLQRAFDAQIERHLAPVGRSLDEFLDFGQLRSCLDARSVLLIQFLGEVVEGAVGLLTLGITKEDAFAAVGQEMLPSATILLTDADRSIQLNWLGVQVSDWREALLEDPGPADVPPEGVDALASASHRLLGGGIAKHLAACRRKGKDHLIVAPHGALHYFPFHLLGAEGALLADEWIVTGIPNLCVLKRRLGHRARSPGAVERRDAFAALGIAFENGKPHDLPPLRDAAEEAREVAEVFGVKALIGAEATEARFREALTSSRIVHLASHGRHLVAAPSFQAVYLWPDEQTDGVFEAWELLSLDLEGLALVGLSACETALGRFDIADNQRGLPASIILAGAETLVGTLWEVESGAARMFFRQFYGRIAAGRERRDAFGEAQRVVRDSYPAYRDWGAFFMSGEWGAC